MDPGRTNPPEQGADGQAAKPDLERREVRELLKRYWHTNLVITVILLVVWASVGLGCGVLLADRFNQYNLPGTGFPLGFWFAQQGSIVVFVVLILIYCLLLNRLDARHRKQLQELNNREA